MYISISHKNNTGRRVTSWQILHLKQTHRLVGCLFTFLSLPLGGAGLDVGVEVEVGEQGEEESSKEEQKCDKHLWIVALHEEGEAGMDGPGDELDQLHAGDVPGEDDEEEANKRKIFTFSTRGISEP